MERWSAIPDVVGYEVSNLGRVRSLDRMVLRTRYGHTFPVRRQGILLRPRTHNAGYVGVELAGRDYLVHRLVMAAFVGPCPSSMEVAHGDGIRNNNELSNLRYATPAENAQDRNKHGTHGRADRGPGARLNWAQVREIRSLQNSLSSYALARRYGVWRSTIANILNGKTWVEQQIGVVV